VGAYLVGSIPTGETLARRAGIDVRASGSGNVGATNVSRAAGWRLGAATLALDVLKGALPVAVVSWADLGLNSMCAASLAAVVGHVYPIFSGFRGGKGVATTLGTLLLIGPDAALALIAVFAVIVRTGRVVSVGSITAAAALPLTLFLFDYPTIVVLTGVAMGALIIWKHRENIVRLRSGSEFRLPR